MIVPPLGTEYVPQSSSMATTANEFLPEFWLTALDVFAPAWLMCDCRLGIGRGRKRTSMRKGRTMKTTKTATTKTTKAAKPVKKEKAKASTPAKATPTKTAKGAKASTPAKADAKKLSQIEAAIQVLAKASEPMNCKAMVEAMTAQGLWSSPGGATPDATLYSSILRDVNTNGKEARFKKTDRGHFTLNGK